MVMPVLIGGFGNNRLKSIGSKTDAITRYWITSCRLSSWGERLLLYYMRETP
jgi:hypothetical protein